MEQPNTTTELGHVPDPLADVFELQELWRIAPWVWDDIRQCGKPRIQECVRRHGYDPHQPQRMEVWVTALGSLKRPMLAAS